MPVERMTIEAHVSADYCLDYGALDPAVQQLYAKGKQRQWDADERLDWSVEVDFEDARQDRFLSI